MIYNPAIHHRRSIRLKGYDYTQAGAYFITICVGVGAQRAEPPHSEPPHAEPPHSEPPHAEPPKREQLFGKINAGKMILNKFGQIVRDEWLLTELQRENVELDAYMVMPDHFHGIVLLKELDCLSCGGTARRAQTEEFGKPVSGSIPTIIRSYKSAVTKKINQIRKTPGASVWQRNYYEHVIRNAGALNRIRHYIIANPANWSGTPRREEKSI